MSKEKFIKKAYRKYRDFEHLIEISSGFLLILAFVIVLPTLAELQLAWLATFIVFAVAINVVVKRFEIINPKLKLEENFKRSLEEQNDKIKTLERRIKKNEK